MSILTFTPRTTGEANRMMEKLERSPFHGEWNMRTGRFEFIEEEEHLDELEHQLSQELTNDIYGYFEVDEV